MKHGRTRVDDREEGGEVQQTEDTDKADVFLAAVCNGTVLDREEDVGITRDGGIIVKRLDCEVGKIPPVIIKATAPVKQQAVNDGTAVEMGAEGVEEGVRVDGDELDGTARDLKHVSALKDGHCCVDLGVNMCRVATNLNRY